MFAVFNRFDRAWEEAAIDLGASPWQRIRHVVLPIIAPSIVGVALFGFTLSYDEFARTLLTAGSDNTLPLEIFGMTTNVTTPCSMRWEPSPPRLSFLAIGVALMTMTILRRAATVRLSESAPQPTEQISQREYHQRRSDRLRADHCPHLTDAIMGAARCMPCALHCVLHAACDVLSSSAH